MFFILLFSLLLSLKSIQGVQEFQITSNFLPFANVSIGCFHDFVEVEKTSLIWPFSTIEAPWIKFNETKIYKSDCFEEYLNQSLDHQINNYTNLTFRKIFNTYLSHGCPFFIKGGFIRDAIEGGVPHDLDVENPCSNDDFLKICLMLVQEKFCYAPGKGYFFIGNKRIHTGVEGMLWNDKPFDIYHLEYTPNTLYYDYMNNVIVDITGMAVSDIINKIFHIPVKREEWDLWLFKTGTDYDRHSSIKAICRYYKLKIMGYNASDVSITNYIKENTIRLWNNETYPMRVMFNFFICRDVMGGIFHIYREKCDLPKVFSNETAQKCRNYINAVKNDFSEFRGMIRDIRKDTFMTDCWNLDSWKSGIKILGIIILILLI